MSTPKEYKLVATGPLRELVKLEQVMKDASAGRAIDIVIVAVQETIRPEKMDTAIPGHPPIDL